MSLTNSVVFHGENTPHLSHPVRILFFFSCAVLDCPSLKLSVVCAFETRAWVQRALPAIWLEDVGTRRHVGLFTLTNTDAGQSGDDWIVRFMYAVFGWISTNGYFNYWGPEIGLVLITTYFQYVSSHVKYSRIFSAAVLRGRCLYLCTVISKSRILLAKFPPKLTPLMNKLKA